MKHFITVIFIIGLSMPASADWLDFVANFDTIGYRTLETSNEKGKNYDLYD